jgi:hypothetical protein
MVFKNLLDVKADATCTNAPHIPHIAVYGGEEQVFQKLL